MNALRQVLADDPRIAYALLFGSSARASAHEHSDLDVAIASWSISTSGPSRNSSPAAS